MTQHIDLSLVGRVRDRGVRGGRERSGEYNGVYDGGKKDGIKYTLSVKSTLFWDFSMHAVSPEIYIYVVFSRVAAASER